MGWRKNESSLPGEDLKGTEKERGKVKREKKKGKREREPRLGKGKREEKDSVGAQVRSGQVGKEINCLNCLKSCLNKEISKNRCPLLKHIFFHVIIQLHLMNFNVSI